MDGQSTHRATGPASGVACSGRTRVECMLREPSAVRTTLGSHALWQPALSGTELQKVEDLAR